MCMISNLVKQALYTSESQKLPYVKEAILQMKAPAKDKTYQPINTMHIDSKGKQNHCVVIKEKNSEIQEFHQRNNDKNRTDYASLNCQISSLYWKTNILKMFKNNVSKEEMIKLFLSVSQKTLFSYRSFKEVDRCFVFHLVLKSIKAAFVLGKGNLV